MTELCDEIFPMLRLAKNLFDHGLAEQFKENFGSWKLDGGDCWELAYEAASWIFQDTLHYYNEDKEIETWLFRDPVIDRFCRLCQEYETRGGISEEQNPYRRDMEQIMHDGFCFDGYSYNYDWRLSSKDRGQKCLLLFTGCEFYSSDEIPGGLMDIKGGFEATVARLEKELSKETRIVPLSLAGVYEEAA